MQQDIFLALHGPHSRSIVVQFVQTALGYGYKNIIISKASGSAATAGIPEASKIAFPQSATLLIVGNISDAINLVDPKHVYLIVSRRYSTEKLDFDSVRSHVGQENKILFVFGGSSPGLSRRDMDLGKACHITWANEEIAPIAYLGIILDRLGMEKTSM